MTGIGEIGVGAFIVTSLVVGGKLLLLAARTRQKPEFALGFGLFALGGLDYILNLLARSDSLLSDDGRAVAMITAVHCGATGILAIALFTTLVFRPGSRAAWAAVFASALGLAGLGVGQGLATGYLAVATHEDPALFIRGFNVIQSAILAWTATESFRYARMLRRRFALGLGNPVVLDRVLLWGRASAIASATFAIYAVGEVIGGDLLASPVWNPILAGLGLSSAICLGLAFFPPQAYERWIRTRATAGL